MNKIIQSHARAQKAFTDYTSARLRLLADCEKLTDKLNKEIKGVTVRMGCCPWDGGFTIDRLFIYFKCDGVTEFTSMSKCASKNFDGLEISIVPEHRIEKTEAAEISAKIFQIIER